MEGLRAVRTVIADRGWKSRLLTARDGENLVTLSLDARTGRELWRREIQRKRSHKIYKANDAASPTAAADDKNVYAFFPDLGLVSYTFEGKERWRHPLGPFQNYYGMASSPIVAGDLVILNCDQQAGSFLVAVDKEAGRQRWRTERPGMTIGWAVPILYERPKKQTEVIVVGSTRIDSYYLATGERRWWVPIASEGAMGSPVIDGDTLFVHARGHDESWMSTYEAMAAQFDLNRDGRVSRDEFRDPSWAEHFGWIDADRNEFIDPAEWNAARSFGSGDYGLMAIRLSDTKGQLPANAVRWRVKRNLPYVPAPVFYGNVLYMVRSGGIITSIDPGSGELLKQGRTEKAPGEHWAQPVAADSKILVLSEEGKLTILRAAPQWEILAVNDLQDESYATPAISGSAIYVRTRASLYCFAARP